MCIGVRHDGISLFAGERARRVARLPRPPLEGTGRLGLHAADLANRVGLQRAVAYA
jgi:hypothetical protein